MCFVCVHKVGPGHVRHLDFGEVSLGEHTADGSPAGVTPAVAGVADDLAAAGVPVRRLDDLATGRWRKLVWNIPFNGLSVVLDAGTDDLMADPATRALARSLMAEVIGAAGACGHPVPERFADDMLRATDAMTPYAPSMKLDHDAGRPLEIGAIYGAPLAAAGAAGFAMPRTAMLAAQLRFLERVSPGRGTTPATPA
jgi:2-dehydropantoate 2-reductase